MQDHLIRLATTDHLTGLLTRRAFFEAASGMLENAQQGQPLSVLICDLDKFKAINDTYGHEVGDLVLKEVAAAAKLVGVSAGRLGGEEIALLVGASLDDALDVAEQFRVSVSGLAICNGDDHIRVSCSIGAAEWEPGETSDTLLRRADVSLYEAKRQGRNRVIAADSYAWSEGHENWRGVARVTLRKYRTVHGGA
jgi:diguanylate cyclase (GGDEF)-like protein